MEPGPKDSASTERAQTETVPIKPAPKAPAPAEPTPKAASAKAPAPGPSAADTTRYLKFIDLSKTYNLDQLPSEFILLQNTGNYAAVARTETYDGTQWLKFSAGSPGIDDDGGYAWKLQPALGSEPTVVHSFIVEFGPDFSRYGGSKFLMYEGSHRRAPGNRPSVFIEPATTRNGRHIHYLRLNGDANGWPFVTEAGFGAYASDWIARGSLPAFIPEDTDRAWMAFSVSRDCHHALYVKVRNGRPPLDGSRPYLELDAPGCNPGNWTMVRGGPAYQKVVDGVTDSTFIRVKDLGVSTHVPTPPDLK